MAVISLAIELLSSVLYVVELLLLFFQYSISHSHCLGTIYVAQHALDVLLHDLAPRGQHDSIVLQRVQFTRSCAVTRLNRPRTAFDSLPWA